jgi:hypothetical protein
LEQREDVVAGIAREEPHGHVAHAVLQDGVGPADAVGVEVEEGQARYRRRRGRGGSSSRRRRGGGGEGGEEILERLDVDVVEGDDSLAECPPKKQRRERDERRHRRRRRRRHRR